ncbi:MAG: ABC transporter ATP-binding protein [Micropruina sp.]|uniref:nickel ABC transporter ATP-binding protein NikE n=1 Tax=Micropruina sp. TaxID=2737536 RepID=UPI0039E583CC
MSAEALLTLAGLSVSYPTGRDAPVPALTGLDLRLDAGERLGLIGPSGSGKSAAGLAIMGLLPDRALATGSVRFAGEELLGGSDRRLSRLRGRRLAWMGQDALAAFTPVYRIGVQIAEAFRLHQPALTRAAAQRLTVERLAEVGLNEPERVARALPDELSGGMRQRAALAMALANEPQLLIADEPTSALDSIRQAEIVQLIRERCQHHRIALLFISHELRVVAQLCDRIAVLDAGRLVETGATSALLDSPTSPTLRGLVAAREPARLRPRVPRDASRDTTTSPILRVRDLVRHFEAGAGVGRRLVKAVDGVSLEVDPGQALALVGESGSGKSTVIHVIAALRRPASGQIELAGQQIGALVRAETRALRRAVQVVLQDPGSSLNPRLTIEQIVSEPLRIDRTPRPERIARVREVLAAVELPVGYLDRRPGQLSGGQRQRVAIARALSVAPRLLLLDEPVSALDAQLRVEMMKLLDRLRRELGLAYLMTAHDLPLALAFADRAAVMSAGRIVDSGSPAELMASGHPDTRRLLAAGGLAESQPASR